MISRKDLKMNTVNEVRSEASGMLIWEKYRRRSVKAITPKENLKLVPKG